MKNSNRSSSLKRRKIRGGLATSLMALPAMVSLIAFSYLPMFGLIMAFQDFSYVRGIFGSSFVGLKNFAYIFKSGEIVRTIGNTIGYHFGTTILVTSFGLMLALLLYFVKSRRAANFFQKTIVMPYMVSYVVIAYIVYILLKNQGGLVNTIIEMVGGKNISWYTEPKYWPAILLMVQVWFGAGIKSIYYYASLMGIDESLFEAADLDGATRWNKICNIMLPSITPVISMFLITDLGNLLESSFSLFYSVPMNSSALYKATDVLSTYTYRGLVTGNIGTTTALGLFTGTVSALGTLAVNGVVRKISPENALF